MKDNAGKLELFSTFLPVILTIIGIIIVLILNNYYD